MVKVAFIGAGSVEFTRNVVTDLCSYPELGGNLELSLHDIDETRLGFAEALANRISAQSKAGAVVTASPDRRTALAGADFVVNEIQVGGYAATRIDFDIPAKYGLRQTIGDTIGIGGIFRGLRTIPVLQGIGRDLADVAADSTLLNYSNPMAMLPWAVYASTPFSRVVGLCHSVRDTHRQLAELVGVPRRRSSTSPRASTTRRSSSRSGAAARTSTRGFARSSRPTPTCSGGSGSKSSAGSATSRPSRASTAPSTCRG